MPEQDQAVRLVFFVEVKCISVESASHVRSFFCLSSRLENSRSRFDKFNHVKYTKTLSVRNRRAANRLLFFASNAPNAHKASSIARFFRAYRPTIYTPTCAAKNHRRSFPVASCASFSSLIFARSGRAFRAPFVVRLVAKKPRMQRCAHRHFSSCRGSEATRRMMFARPHFFVVPNAG